jgi:hypothetical protein
MEREGLHCCMWWCSDVNAACLSAVIKPVGEKLSVCQHGDTCTHMCNLGILGAFFRSRRLQ